MEQFKSPVMYPDEVTSLWKMPPYNSKEITIMPVFSFRFHTKRCAIVSQARLRQPKST